MSEYLLVITTTTRRDEAEAIAYALVEKRLAGCVQISGPIRSVYRWKGALEESDEWQVTAKTRRDLFAKVEAAISAVHPFEVPEILALPIMTGSRAYLDWLDGELTGPA